LRELREKRKKKKKEEEERRGNEVETLSKGWWRLYAFSP